MYFRYLESCNVSNTVKRKYQFSSNTTSSNSDEDKNASDASLQQTNGNFVFLGFLTVPEDNVLIDTKKRCFFQFLFAIFFYVFLDSLGMEATSLMSIKTNEKPPPGPAPGRVIGGPLSPLDLASKADSVVSQCSYSSTIVHVGDKKTQPESGTGSHTLSQKNRAVDLML